MTCMEGVVCHVEVESARFRQARSGLKAKVTTTQQGDPASVEKHLKQNNITASSIKTPTVLKKSTFDAVVKQKVDKDLKKIEDAKTKTISSAISTASLPLMSSKTIMISSPRSSESNRMRSSVSIKDSSSIKRSKTMHMTSTIIPKESSMLIKPSKTSQMIVTQTKEITPKPTDMNIIGCGKKTPKVNVENGGHANFTNEKYPSGYESFSICGLKISAVKGPNNFIVCSELVLGYGSSFSFYDGENMVKKFTCVDRSSCYFCGFEQKISEDKAAVQLDSCMFSGIIKCAFESRK